MISFPRLQAERTFSIKKNMETLKRKVAARDYFSSMMFLSCNRASLLTVARGGTNANIDHFSSLLDRAKETGRGSYRILSSATRKRRRVSSNISISIFGSDSESAMSRSGAGSPGSGSTSEQ